MLRRSGLEKARVVKTQAFSGLNLNFVHKSIIMQHSLTINLPEEFRTLYAANPETALLKLLDMQKEPLALMIQGYHAREKVRHVNFIADSLELEGTGKGSFSVSYQLEEYNVCSAIDRTDMERMKLTFTLDQAIQTMKISGVFIPEREPDSF